MKNPSRIHARIESSSDSTVIHDISSRSSWEGDADRALAKRLAAVSLVYVLTYLAAFSFGIIQNHIAKGHPLRPFDLAAITISIVAGLVIMFLCRRPKYSPVSISMLAMIFHIGGGLGIAAGMWGWESHFDLEIRGMWEAIESKGQFSTQDTWIGEGAPESSTLISGFIGPLAEGGFRLIRHPGVHWVGVWILIYPILIPGAPWRILLGSIMTASTLPLIIFGSIAVNGMPETIRPWVSDIFLEVMIPTLICIGIAYYSARFLHKLNSDLSRAKRLGSYELVERIGEGGMGEVWRARHKMLVRPAAIKLIRPEKVGATTGSAARTAIKRFDREAQLTAALHSPHTIQIYDFGVTDDGAFYYVMELLGGLDLRTLVEQYGPLPAGRAIHILRQVCHSLADAHASGMVHRDIKPGNVFISRRGQDYDFVTVLDFGLVKETSAPGGDVSHLTMDGVASGTPGFMAPEMASGPQSVGPVSDIYSLGCLAYWLLTGQLVFEGATPVAVLLAHIQNEPLPPSSRTELEIPEELDRIVLDCLEKNEGRRPSSAQEISDRLAACVTLSEQWSEERAEKWWRTNRPAISQDAGN